MILLAIADNQLAPARAWQEQGAAIDMGPLNGVDGARLTEAFAIMQATPVREAQTRALYRAEVDGCGAVRVADAIERKLMA